MLEGSQEGVHLYILEDRIKLNNFVRENLKILEDRFPVQVNAAKAAREYIRLCGEDPTLITHNEFTRIMDTKGHSKTAEERLAFQSAYEGLIVLEKIASKKDQEEILQLGKKLGLILQDA